MKKSINFAMKYLGWVGIPSLSPLISRYIAHLAVHCFLSQLVKWFAYDICGLWMVTYFSLTYPLAGTPTYHMKTAMVREPFRCSVPTEADKTVPVNNVVSLT